jgi:hypothetical protein
MVTWNRRAARVLRVAATPPRGRFAGIGTLGPARAGTAMRRTGKCRGPPAVGVKAEPA